MQTSTAARAAGGAVSARPADATARAVATARCVPSCAEVEALAGEFGDTFFLLDLDRVREAHAELLQAFRSRYPDVVPAYSVKTNYTPRLLKLMRELGCLAEVVSEMEYEIASRAGFPAGEMVVNGPLHGEGFLERLLLEGEARIHLDGWYMLETLGRLGRAHPERQFRVGLRLGYPIPGAGESRFGFAAGDGGLRRLSAWFRAHPNCRVVGLHSHFPLAPYGLDSFRARAEGLADAAAWFGAIEYLDLGGGFRRCPEGPSCAEVADVVAGVLAERLPGGTAPRLLIEPGTALVADAMAFLCRVYDVKRVGERTVALVNGSNHDVNTMMWHTRLAVRVMRGGGEPVHGPFDVVGNTCMERKDWLCTDVQGPVARGDYLLFDAVGAYSCALKPPFIHPCPPVVAREGGGYEVVKRRETADDILRSYL